MPSVSEALDRTLLTANPLQLESEIRAIPSFPQQGLQIYKQNGGILVHIDEVVAPLTPALIAQLDTVLAAHQPDFSAELQQEAFKIEVASNDLCTADLSDIDTRINTFRDSVNADIVAASTVAQIKTVMTTMNTTYAVAFRKTARCVRARAR